MVWLKLGTKDLVERVRNSSPFHYGPFKIIKKIGDNAFQLELPEYMHMYSVVNAEYLKLFEPSLLEDGPVVDIHLPTVEDLLMSWEEALKDDCLKEEYGSEDMASMSTFRLGRKGGFLTSLSGTPKM